MPITIVSGNLNGYGNAGQFETDRSTWNFADTSTYSVTRSPAQSSAGLYSALVVKNGLTNSLLIPCRFATVGGSKYLIQAKVRVPSAALIAGNSDKITLNVSSDNPIDSCVVIKRTDKTVLEATNTWVTVDIQIQRAFSLPLNGISIVWLRIDGTAILNGQINVDQFEVYRFTGSDDPPVSPLQFDNPSFDDELAPWDSVNPASAYQDFVWDASHAAIADGLLTNKSSTAWLRGRRAGGGSWPIGDYVVEVVLENQTEGSSNIAISETLAVAGFLNDPNVITAIPRSIDAIVHRGGGNQTRTLTFTTTQVWTYLAIRLYSSSNFPDIKGIIKSVHIVEGPNEAVLETVKESFLSKNPIVFIKGSVGGWEAIVNYRLYNDVRVEDEADSGVFVSKLKMELPPDVTGNAIFYLNESFRDCFSFTPPLQNASSIVRLTDRIKRFKNYSGTLQELQTEPSLIVGGDTNLVLYGGIDKFNYPGVNYLKDYLPTNQKFLTWAPVEKYVDRLQEDYLNFWSHSAETEEMQLQLKAYYDDGTNETDIATTAIGILHLALYQIPAGPSNSGVMLINPLKNVTHYELTLLDQNDEVISETRTYYVAAVRLPLTRFFMFLNSLGSYEVLRFYGQAIEESEFVREPIQKFLPHNYNALDGEYAVNNVTMQRKNNYSTGFFKGRMAAAWHDYMKDFLLSPKIFDVTNGTRIPVAVTEGQLRKEDQNYQRFMRFETKSPYNDQSYTPRL